MVLFVPFKQKLVFYWFLLVLLVRINENWLFWSKTNIYLSKNWFLSQKPIFIKENQWFSSKNKYLLNKTNEFWSTNNKYLTKPMILSWVTPLTFSSTLFGWSLYRLSQAQLCPEHSHGLSFHHGCMPVCWQIPVYRAPHSDAYWFFIVLLRTSIKA